MSDIEAKPQLDRDYSLDEVAAALGMSERWLRGRIKKGEAGELPVVEHLRYGHKIKFTPAQVEQLRADHVQTPPVAEGITTGKKKTA